MICLHTFKKDKKNDKVSNYIVAFFRKCLSGRHERQTAYNLQLPIFISECRQRFASGPLLPVETTSPYKKAYYYKKVIMIRVSLLKAHSTN